MNRLAKRAGWAGLLLGWALVAGAEPVRLLQEDFEGHTADELLPKKAGEGRATFGYDDAAPIRVVGDWMSGLLGEGNLAARLFKETGKGGCYLDVFPARSSVLSFSELAAAKLKLVYRFNVNFGGSNTNRFYVALRATSNSENLCTVFFGPPAQRLARVGWAIAGEGEKETGIRVPVETWLQVVCELRPLPGGEWAFSASLIDRESQHATQLVEKTVVPLMEEGPSFNRLRFYQFGSPGGENVSLLDEISVAYEDAESPASIAPAPSAAAPQAAPAPKAPEGFRVLEEKTITNSAGGYTAWPSMALLPDGELLVVASGGRLAHACPFGKGHLYRSGDLGKTWSGPQTIQNGGLDDRGFSLLATSRGTLLAGSFPGITWLHYLTADKVDFDREKLNEAAQSVTLEDFRKEAGFWQLRSVDGGKTWERQRAPVDSPHGPCELDDGSLLFVGYETSAPANLLGGRPATGGLVAVRSEDDGVSWKPLSRIPTAAGHRSYQYHEPHAVQAADGSVIVHIRKNYPKNARTLQVISRDRGATWSQPEEVYWGYPSHLLRLKDGRLLATYGYRKAPLGIRASVSTDNGKSWGGEVILADKATSGDMGYPATVELPDGTLLTVWYEKPKTSSEAVLKTTHWELGAK